jgi:hypothetical protein
MYFITVLSINSGEITDEKLDTAFSTSTAVFAAVSVTDLI